MAAVAICQNLASMSASVHVNWFMPSLCSRKTTLRRMTITERIA